MKVAVRRWATVPVLVCGLTMPVGPGSAAEAPTVYQQLAALNPGTTAAEMRKEAKQYAAERGGTAAKVAKSALAEARSRSIEAARTSSSGGGGKHQLPFAKQPGDIFWWDSQTDHVGLYATTKAVIHAPGPGEEVKVQPVGAVEKKKHIELMLVNSKDDGKKRIKAAARTKVVNWAKKKQGKPYNYNFAFNKKINAKRYNCSQLVWAAWKATSGIDLDNGLSKGVYPGDIRDDRRTHVYTKRKG